MNTAQIKKFAQESRKKLITLVGGKLEAVLSQDSAVLRAKTDTINKLRNEVDLIGKEALINKVAYIWFNRLVALRFMDANDFQPLGINVLSPALGTTHTSPQILNDVQAGIFPIDLPLDQNYVNNILSGVITSNNPENDVYRHVLIAVCNDLHRIFPFLFERIDDYTELLFPDDLTSPFSIVADVVDGMSIEDCTEVEIIGWLYQFYISEKKDEVFASKSKVKKEDIPAATQLFTPRWIVEYMVQNTVGKLWLQNHPESALKDFMPYYIDSVNPAGDYLKINSVEEIKLLDQACGSGHIFVYGFELFAKIYEEQGYSASEIPAKIIENNLFGLEIDERAAQLAAFAITMKARQYYRRFFRKVVTPNIICYEDIKFNADEVSAIIEQYNIQNKDAFKADLKLLEQATNLGSLIKPNTDGNTLEKLQQILDNESDSDDVFRQKTQIKLCKAVKQLVILSRKHHCVVDNPPYMGGGNMNSALSDFVKVNYPKSKADLMACFMEAGITTLYPNGFLGMINQHSWMFLSSYEELRKQLINDIHFDTLLHLGPRTFPEIGGEVVQNAAFTFENKETTGKGTYIRLVDYDSSELKRQKTLEAIQNPNCGWFYAVNQKNFKKIPGFSFGYWMTPNSLLKFELGQIADKADLKIGLSTGDNMLFTRMWFEVNLCETNINGNLKYSWIKLLSGGEKRKWYGNHIKIVNWKNNGFAIKKHLSSVIRNESYYFRTCLDWSRISTDFFGVRINDSNFIFDTNSGCVFVDEKEIYNYAAFLNSKVSLFFNNILSPTLSFQVGDVSKLPFSNVQEIGYVLDKSMINFKISKQEWNSRETSWDFLQNELIRLKNNDQLLRVNDSVEAYKNYWTEQFHILHKNEEELNRQFIDIYGLKDELTPDVPLEDITILKEESEIVDDQLVFKEEELIKQLLSYAVGCIFGRYSLDKEGLILANQGETFVDFLSKVEKTKEQLQFVPDEDNVVPLLEEEWFDDDIVNRVKSFIRAVWGEASYGDNIHYIEETLGKDLCKYMAKDFYKDHIKRYKKRPTYWMFSSPKGHFNVLIYMHRYTPDTLNFILNSYLRPFIEKVRNDLQRQEDIIVIGSAAEQGRARKRQDKLKDILKDCEAYEYDVLFSLAGERISIDLDDGVLVNYNKFGEAIASVAGLNDAATKKKVKGFDWIDTSTIR